QSDLGRGLSPARMRLRPLAIIAPLLLVTANFPAPPASAVPPLVGFSFSPNVLPAGENAAASLARLLAQLNPDLVRLPVYWDQVELSPGRFDFQAVDRLLQVVAKHDSGRHHRLARVVLVVGARNIGYPEVYVPSWLAPEPP